MFKYLSSLFLAVALLFAAQALAQTFAHYVGASEKAAGKQWHAAGGGIQL